MFYFRFRIQKEIRDEKNLSTLAGKKAERSRVQKKDVDQSWKENLKQKKS